MVKVKSFFCIGKIPSGNSHTVIKGRRLFSHMDISQRIFLLTLSIPNRDVHCQ